MRIDFQTIYLDQNINTNQDWQARAQAIINRFPNAEVKPVESHARIEELRNSTPENWIQTKQNYLVLGVRKSLTSTPNKNSSDFIAPGSSRGCLSACSYCYVARHTGGSNPLTVFVNIEQIADSIDKKQQKLGFKPCPNQQGSLWVFDIGCNSDCSLDALISDNPLYLIQRFARMEYAMATFATKTVNEAAWLSVEPKGHTRIRYSLMPQKIAQAIDIRTSPISARIRSINNLVEHGYEVHVNFSPIVIYGGDQWRYDWVQLWSEMNDVLTPQAKAQLKAEAFFLTHSADLHQVNLQWTPQGEDYLWQPEIQQVKAGKADVLCYRYDIKREEVNRFKHGLKKFLPYCELRYIF